MSRITYAATRSIIISTTLICLSLSALAQDGQSTIAVRPDSAVRGQLVWITLSQEPALVRVMRATHGADIDASTADDGSPSLVRVMSDAGTHTYVYSSAISGDYYVEAVMIDGQRAIIHRAIFAIADSMPPPPAPDIAHAPFASPEGLRVLLWSDVETRGALSPQTLSFLGAASVREYLASITVREVDGTPGYRVWDTDYTDAQLARISSDQAVTRVWRDAYLAARRIGQDRQSRHLLLAASPRGGYAGPIPESEDALRKIVEQLR